MKNWQNPQRLLTLTLLALIAIGCRSPKHPGGIASPAGGACQVFCDPLNDPCRRCSSCCVPGCFGFEPTCWSRWPADCPSHCAADEFGSGGPPVFLHEDFISDEVYPEDPAWELPVNDQAPSESSELPAIAPQPIPLSSGGREELQQSRRRPRELHLRGQTPDTASRPRMAAGAPVDEPEQTDELHLEDRLWWTDIAKIRPGSSERGAQDQPPNAEAATEKGRGESEGGAARQSSRRSNFHRASSTIARTSAVATPGVFDVLDRMPESSSDRFAAGGSQLDRPPRSASAAPAQHRAGAPTQNPEVLPAIDLVRDPRTNAPVRGLPEASTPGGMERLPQVEPEEIHRPGDRGSRASIERPAIRFSQTKTRTPADASSEERRTSILRFR